MPKQSKGKMPWQPKADPARYKDVDLPVVSAAKDNPRAFGQAICDACDAGGMFYLVDHDIPQELIDTVLAQTAAFFAQSDEEKASIHIKNSTNHRGYGLLKNYRDWREQIHLGVEAKALPPDASAPYWDLWGVNQWPQSKDDLFKQTMLAYFAAIDDLARCTLTSLAMALDKPDDFFTARMKDRPYLLIKAMSYLPQENIAANNSELQHGVTAHCDWSWLTFLIQDQVGGLEAQDKDGFWHRVDPRPGAIVVNTGELLEIESGGQISASPHRVINSRIDKKRYSVPVFVNPALDAEIIPAGIFMATAHSNDCNDQSSGLPHVHKVIVPGSRLQPFIFGTSEWQRKAQGQWCYQTECLKAI